MLSKVASALRFNSGKVPFHLVPPEAEEAIAEHYGRGALKYPPRNWEKGLDLVECAGSLRRHYNKWLQGEDYDPETGSHHMIAVAWNAIAIFVCWVRGVGTDNRRRGELAHPLYLPVPDELKALAEGRK